MAIVLTKTSRAAKAEIKPTPTLQSTPIGRSAGSMPCPISAAKEESSGAAVTIPFEAESGPDACRDPRPKFDSSQSIAEMITIGVPARRRYADDLDQVIRSVGINRGFRYSGISIASIE